MLNFKVIRLLIPTIVAVLLIAGSKQHLLQMAIATTLLKPQVAQQKPPQLDTANRIYLADKRVSFVPPAGFTPMTAKEIALKFPDYGSFPKYVYGNKRRTVTIAITFSSANISPAQLPELKNFMIKFLTLVMPNMAWITRDFAVINNVRWVKLEFISQAIDTKIHNQLYLTSFNNKMLGFNFNATVEQYDALKAELRKSRDSIIVN